MTRKRLVLLFRHTEHLSRAGALEATIGAALRYQTLRSLTATEIGAEPQGMLRKGGSWWGSSLSAVA